MHACVHYTDPCMHDSQACCMHNIHPYYGHMRLLVLDLHAIFQPISQNSHSKFQNSHAKLRKFTWPNFPNLNTTTLEITPLKTTPLKTTPLEIAPLHILPLEAIHSKLPHSNTLPLKPPHSTPLNSNLPTGWNRSSGNRFTQGHLTQVAALLRLSPLVKTD